MVNENLNERIRSDNNLLRLLPIAKPLSRVRSFEEGMKE